MNPNYNQTVTLYNCLKAKDNLDKKEIWQKTVLEHCFYKAKMTEVQNGIEAKKANIYIVRIPENARYLPYNQWKNLPEEERAGYFTVSEGDVLIRGECREDITGISPATAAQMLIAYNPDAFRITAFSDNTFHRMGRHYRLEG